MPAYRSLIVSAKFRIRVPVKWLLKRRDLTVAFLGACQDDKDIFWQKQDTGYNSQKKADEMANYWRRF